MNADKGSALHAESFSKPELTPAASEKLDQSIEYVRLQILREISRKYRDSGHRARASDVDSAVSRISVFDSASRFGPYTTILAIALGSFTLLVQVLSQIVRPNELSLNSGVSLLVGITSGTTVVLVIQESRRRKRMASGSLQELLHAFILLEDSMRKHARELIGPAADNASLGRVISALELLQLWTPEDSHVFRRLLGIRNTIVHEDSQAISADKVASAFSKIARLSSLLDSDESSDVSKHRIKDFAANRAALSFEERVTNALRRAGIDVSSAQGNVDYDLLAGKSDLFKRIVIKYRRAGLLTVNDINDIVERLQHNVATIIVTNAAISPYVYEYLDLTQSNSESGKQVVVMRWQNNENTNALVHAIIAKDAADV
jgi:hypothetical protein